jgi:hypothetical protein
MTFEFRSRSSLLPCLVAIVLLWLVLAAPAEAQRGRGGAVAPQGQAGAPFDMTGNWVSYVTEDWRFRMVTPPAGDFNGVRLTPEGVAVVEAWDPELDEAEGLECKAYGAAAIMRVPGRFNITWENEQTLRIDIDAGMQTRQFYFGDAASEDDEPTWQGHSVAEWEITGGRGADSTGKLIVKTSGMRAGYLRKNGVPYSEDAEVTETYRILEAPNGESWLMVLTVVDDPLYLNDRAVPTPGHFVTSTQFKRESDGSGWNPQPCTAR